MKYKYVAIEREYGSKGTEIGKRLSERTGIPCYGREILEETAKRLSLSVEQIENYEEKPTNSFLYSFYIMAKNTQGSSDMLSNEDKIFLEEQDTIKRFSMQGPAIFVGRCAVRALADRKDVLTVFIHSDISVRKENAVKDYGIAESSVEKVVSQFDKKRSNYYSINAGRKWNDWNNYHMVLDSGKLGIEECVNIIDSMIR